MTQEEIQIAVAVADVVLAATIGVAAVIVARTANRLMGLQTELVRLQTHSAISPRVTIEIVSHVAEASDPVNLIDITNHSPLVLDSASLSGEIFATGPDAPKLNPYPRPIEFLDTLPPRGSTRVSIDSVINEAADLVPFKQSPLGVLTKAHVKLTLRYRRKEDGEEFQTSKMVTIHPVEAGRPMAAEFEEPKPGDVRLRPKVRYTTGDWRKS